LNGCLQPKKERLLRAKWQCELDLSGWNADLDHRTGQIETRLSVIQRSLASIDTDLVDRGEAARALAAVDPVWDALVPREQASLLQLLIERIRWHRERGGDHVQAGRAHRTGRPRAAERGMSPVKYAPSTASG
jgi:hypothetical protein